MLIDDFANVVVVIAHEAGHAVTAWASPMISPPMAIRFFPLYGGAECEVVSLPEPNSTTDCLEFASLFLGGIAGETAVFGGFNRLAGNDLSLALAMAVWVRKLRGAPKRRARRTYFLSKIHPSISRELHGFLDQSYDLAVSRVTAHKAAHDELRNLLARGYASGKIEWKEAELAACLGPKPP
ncbi:MAG: hypothetical protein AAB554_01400 [Patescibacteria group bacterium]